jgi:hypothetical protein
LLLEQRRGALEELMRVGDGRIVHW